MPLINKILSLCLLAEISGLAQANRNGGLEIIVPAAAVTKDTFEIPPGQKLHSNGVPPPLILPDPGHIRLRDLFPGREPRRIVVAGYSTRAGYETPEDIRTKLFELSRREIESPMGSIMWAEWNQWSIDARLEFASGPPIRILTDGSHTCLIDQSGRKWFFRISPVEFVCGYETPEKALRRDTTNWCRFREF